MLICGYVTIELPPVSNIGIMEQVCGKRCEKSIWHSLRDLTWSEQ